MRQLRAAATPMRYVTVVVCLALVLVGAARPTTWTWQAPTWRLPQLSLPTLPSMAPAPSGNALPQPPTVGANGGVIGRIIVMILGLAALVVLAWFLRRLVVGLLAARIDRVPKADALAVSSLGAAQPVTAAVVDGVELALARLDAAGTPKDAVIAAWLALEETAAMHGIERSPAQTPTEFVLDLLQRSSAPVAATNQLRRLYHQARFSAADTAPAARASARQALAAIARHFETVAA